MLLLAEAVVIFAAAFIVVTTAAELAGISWHALRRLKVRRWYRHRQQFVQGKRRQS